MAIKSDNTQGNPYHNEADGKFTSANDAGTKKTDQSSYQKYLDSNAPFSDWDSNAQNHFVDDKLAMPYFEQTYLPQIMEQYGYTDFCSMVGTTADKDGIDYIFADSEGDIVKVDLKNVKSAFGGDNNFNNANISFRLKQTVKNKETGNLDIVPGYILNKDHQDDKMFIQCLNVASNMETIGQNILDGNIPEVNDSSLFVLDSNDVKETIHRTFKSREDLDAMVTENLSNLMADPNFFNNKGYAIKHKNGRPSHIIIPITKLGSVVTKGAHFAYDITYNSRGEPTRFTCNLIVPKNEATNKYIFKSSKKILTRQ